MQVRIIVVRGKNEDMEDWCSSQQEKVCKGMTKELREHTNDYIQRKEKRIYRGGGEGG